MAPYCIGKDIPRGFNNYKEFINTLSVYKNAYHDKFLGIAFDSGNDEYNGLLSVMTYLPFLPNYMIMSFMKFYFDELNLSEVKLKVNVSEFMSDALPNKMEFLKFMYLWLPGYALGLFLGVSMSQLEEFQESKMMQLLLISGVHEYMIWLVFFINEFILMFIWSLCTSMGYSLHYDKVVSFGILFVESILLSLTNL